MKCKTFKNKICALLLISAGMLPLIVDKDGTFLLITLIFGLPLFFAKKNYIR